MDTAYNIDENLGYHHAPLSKTDLYPNEDTVPLIRAIWVFSTQNVEPGTAQPAFYKNALLFRGDDQQGTH